jgi:hypothetical protein
VHEDAAWAMGPSSSATTGPGPGPASAICCRHWPVDTLSNRTGPLPPATASRRPSALHNNRHKGGPLGEEGGWRAVGGWVVGPT